MISTDLLVAWLNIALDHETFYHGMKLRIYLTAVKNLACDTNLLLVMLVGVGMVGIHDYCRVGKVLCVVFVIEKTKILIMVVRDSFSVFVYRTTKDCVGERVTGGLNFPASVNEAVSALCCNDGVQHNAVVATGRILHTSRNVHAADCQSVLLIFNRTCTYSNVGKKIRKITVVLRVKHLICTGKTTFADGTYVHLTDCNQSGKKVRFLLRIRLMDHSFVSFSGCTWFVCVNTRDNEDFILDLFLYFAKS